MNFGISVTVDFMQSLGAARRSGILEIKGTQASGTLWFFGGRVIKADVRIGEIRTDRIREAVFALLDVTDPSMSWREQPDELDEAVQSAVAQQPVEQLVLDYATQMDKSVPIVSQYVLFDRTHSKAYRLINGRSTVGRTNLSQIVIQHPTISKEHALLEVSGTDICLTDLDSMNGTSVNGDPVTIRRLKLHDTVHLGDVELVVEESSYKPTSETTFLGKINDFKKTGALSFSKKKDSQGLRKSSEPPKPEK